MGVLFVGFGFVVLIISDLCDFIGFLRGYYMKRFSYIVTCLY